MPKDSMRIDIDEVNEHLSRLLRRVTSGDEIVIVQAGVPVARLVPVERRRKRVFGVDRGRFRVPDDFDSPLPEVEALFGWTPGPDVPSTT